MVFNPMSRSNKQNGSTTNSNRQFGLVVIVVFFLVIQLTPKNYLNVSILGTTSSHRPEQEKATGTAAAAATADSDGREAEKKPRIRRTASEMFHVCNSTSYHYGTTSAQQVYLEFCYQFFFETLDETLLVHGEDNDDDPSNHQKISHVVQIGAHTSFEPNDPLAVGLTRYLELFPPATRQRLHWTFVEPSPANYQRLVLNIANHSHLCTMKAMQMAVVPEDQANSTMTFYSISSSIDPETGYDSISGKTFPYYITQLSSFSMAPIRFNRNAWRKLGLKMEDYVVPINVTTKGYSELMHEIMGPEMGTSSSIASTATSPTAPVLVLIDTEGFDCKIVQSIPPPSPYLPKFLIFESKICKKELAKTYDHLASMGYYSREGNGDAFMFRANSSL
jgi:hypothetical protein